MFKSINLILSFMLLSIMLGCGQEKASQGPSALSNKDANQIEAGGSQIEHVDSNDAENPKFNENLKAFQSQKSVLQDVYQTDAEQVWGWIMDSEKTFQQGMLQQFTYTEEQMKEIDAWASEYLGIELKKKRLEKALRKLDDGYALENIHDLYHFHYDHVEKVLDLDLKVINKNRVTLVADLIVKHNTKVKVTYTLEQNDGKWKLADSDLKLEK